MIKIKIIQIWKLENLYRTLQISLMRLMLDAAVFTPELFFRKSARLSWGVAKMTMGNVKISTVIEY